MCVVLCEPSRQPVIPNGLLHLLPQRLHLPIQHLSVRHDRHRPAAGGGPMRRMVQGVATHILWRRPGVNTLRSEEGGVNLSTPMGSQTHVAGIFKNSFSLEDSEPPCLVLATEDIVLLDVQFCGRSPSWSKIER